MADRRGSTSKIMPTSIMAIAIEVAKGTGIRSIARKLGRSPSTISRELKRNAATRSGSFDYRASTAQWHADRAARRPKPSKLATHTALRDYVQEIGRASCRDRVCQYV